MNWIWENSIALVNSTARQWIYKISFLALLAMASEVIMLGLNRGSQLIIETYVDKAISSTVLTRHLQTDWWERSTCQIVEHLYSKIRLFRLKIPILIVCLLCVVKELENITLLLTRVDLWQIDYCKLASWVSFCH